jgi:hypothetical protein
MLPEVLESYGRSEIITFLRVFPVALVLSFLFCPTAKAVILEPLGLQDAQLLNKETGELRIGFSYASGLRNQFQRQDLDRRVAEIPSLTLNLGLGERVEGQVSFSYLRLDEDGQGTKWGSGDLIVAFKVRLLREIQALPALAFRIATKFPNTDHGKDLGTNEADIFLDLLVTRHFSVLSTTINLGLAILGDPGPTNEGQDDLWRYGLGVRIPLRPKVLDFLLSVEGLTFEDSVNQRGAVRGGLQLFFDRFIWDLGGSAGYISKSEDWSVRTGLTFPFDLPPGW